VPHFFFFPAILDSTEAGAFLFCDFLEYSLRGEKTFAPFSYVFLGVHFTAFGALERVINALSVCIAETQSLSCVLFTFCTISINFHWSNSSMSCSPAVMYSVCKRDISESSKSEPVYAFLAIIFSEHTQQRI